MRWLIWVLLGAWGLGFAQTLTPSQPGAQAPLERCQVIFSALRPQYLYAERQGSERFLIRALLGRGGAVVTRITLSLDLTPVPMGLEDIAVQQLTRPVADRVRLQNLFARRFNQVGRDIDLGNWVTREPGGFRCFLTFTGRVVGVIRLDEGLSPVADPRWMQAYGRSPVRYPADVSEQTR